MTSGKIRASIVTGCVVERDAISNVTLQMADALGRPGRVGGEVAHVRVFCMGRGVADTRVVEVPSADRLAVDPHFQTSDLIVFNYGIRYDAFDAIHLAPRTARVLAYYFGVTPAAVCGPADGPIVRDSYRQAAHLAAADGVMVSSRHLEGEVRLHGVAADRVVRMPLAVAVNPVPRRPRLLGGPVRFLYVGRFVPAKGVHDLLEAFAAFANANLGATLDLAGSRVFSDKKYLAGLQAQAGSPVLRDRVRFHLDLPSAALSALYAGTDAFVLPSYHEGFGVPIVEALASGCYVVCSDAGASPETAGGLGLVFKAGDVDELTTRLVEVAEAWEAGERPTDGGPLTPAEWYRAATAYAATYSRAAFEERFRAVTLGGLRTVPAGLREVFAEARTRVMAGVKDASGDPVGELSVYDKFRRMSAESVARRAA